MLIVIASAFSVKSKSLHQNIIFEIEFESGTPQSAAKIAQYSFDVGH